MQYDEFYLSIFLWEFFPRLVTIRNHKARSQENSEMNPLTAQENGVQPPDAFVKALRRLLRPLVRTLVANGLAFPYLAAMLKSIYVEVAEAEFGNTEARMSDSRISLMTGVHRKDVRRLRADPDRADYPPPVVGLRGQIMLLWTGSRDYLDSEGRPLPLPRSSDIPGAPSFDRLVESVSKDVRPRAVLDEWLRLGVARLDASGRVCLEPQAFTPEKGFDEKAYFFGRNIRDHVAAAGENLAGRVPPFLERTVYYDHLSAVSADALGEAARRIGMEALLAMNREALARSQTDESDPDARHRMSFGVYFYSTPEDMPGEDGEPVSESGT